MQLLVMVMSWLGVQALQLREHTYLVSMHGIAFANTLEGRKNFWMMIFPPTKNNGGSETNL